MRFHLDGPDELRFVDQRMFGGLALSTGGAELPGEIAHIARDPMDPEFDDELFVAAGAQEASGIKRILLDQSVVSGVGNIYADEALWLARLHGDRPGNRLRRADVVEVLAGVRAVMQSALAQGGTSFDALYVNVNGESGYFDRSLAGLRPGGRALRTLRHPDRAGVLHEPFVLLLPGVPAAPAALPLPLNGVGHRPGPVDRGPRLGGHPLAPAACAGEQRLPVEPLAGGVPGAHRPAGGDLQRTGHGPHATGAIRRD